MDISFDRRKVSDCLQKRFSLPTYQRDYKWEIKHLRELLTDIQEAFLEYYRPEHGRADVARYGEYFLGTIITTPSGDGPSSIVDGQQRITTLALVIAYFSRLASAKPNLRISDLTPLLRGNIFGAAEFNISFPPARAQLFSLILDFKETEDGPTLEDAVYSIPGLDAGTERLYELYLHIEPLVSNDINETVVPFFVDYLIEGVQLFEIGVPGEQDGHKVFVTMNDRGLKLGPIDLLKGFLLSNVSDNESNIQAHRVWNESLRKLKTHGDDADSAFIKDWLRARYADSIRGKHKGAGPKDFEVIGDSYHRWVVDNRARLGLGNADDFFNLVTTTLPSYVAHYELLRASESTFNPAYSHLYFNRVRDLTLQSMTILAAIKPNDASSEVSRKMKMVSFYLDYLATFRTLNRQDNTYNNLRDPLFSLAKSLRDKNSTQIADILVAEMAANPLPSLGNVAYFYWTSQEVLHILARLGHYLEKLLELTNRTGFPAYVQRARSNKTFDVEHVLSASHAQAKADLGADYDFADIEEFTKSRHSIGALILLSRGRNRSLQASGYGAKRPIYATESVLAQTLTDGFYGNNPQVSAIIQEKQISLVPLQKFNKAAIASRLALYDQLAALVWSPTELVNLKAVPVA